MEFHRAVAVGTATGALNAYEEILRAKKWILPRFTARFEMPELQMRFDEPIAMIDTAEAALLAFAKPYAEACRLVYEVKQEFTPVASRRLHRAGPECVELAYQAVDLMLRPGGSSSAAKSSRLGRYFGRLSALRQRRSTRFSWRALPSGFSIAGAGVYVVLAVPDQ